MSIRQYLQSLSDQPTTLLNENKPPAYPMPMTDAWAQAMRKAEDENPQAVELLRLLAFFGPQQIPLEIIRIKPLDDKPQEPGQPILSARSSVLVNAIALGRAVRTIREYGLADVDSEHDTMQVHKLIQLLMRADLTDDKSTQEFRHDAQVLLARKASANQDGRSL